MDVFFSPLILMSTQLIFTFISFSLQTEILAEEIGENVDDKHFKDILKNESTTKRLSVRLSDAALV